MHHTPCIISESFIPFIPRFRGHGVYVVQKHVCGCYPYLDRAVAMHHNRCGATDDIVQVTVVAPVLDNNVTCPKQMSHVSHDTCKSHIYTSKLTQSVFKTGFRLVISVDLAFIRLYSPCLDNSLPNPSNLLIYCDEE